MIIDEECPTCRGEGTILGDDMVCPRCDGSGCIAVDLNEECDDD